MSCKGWHSKKEYIRDNCVRVVNKLQSRKMKDCNHSFYKCIFNCNCFFSNTGIDGLSLEVSNIVDIRQEINREIAMRLITDVKSNNQFFTDLNDFQVLMLFKMYADRKKIRTVAPRLW